MIYSLLKLPEPSSKENVKVSFLELLAHYCAPPKHLNMPIRDFAVPTLYNGQIHPKNLKMAKLATTSA